MENLNLKMIQAHTDGVIIDITKKALLSSDMVFEKFVTLCDNKYCESFGKDEVYEIMSYMMEGYANMRGTFFAKHLKTNGTGDPVKKMANSQSTRAQVANIVFCSKAAGEAVAEVKVVEMKIEAIWKYAEDNVLQYADEVESRDIEE